MNEETKVRLSVSEWQTRITETFFVNGVVGTTVSQISKHENAFAHYVTKNMRGHDFIMHAFFDFFIETLQTYSTFLQKFGWPSDRQWYGIYIAKFISIFRSFRAADKLFYASYPLDAYSLLRDIKDRVFTLAFVANQYSTLDALEGLQAGSVRNHKDYEKRHKIIKQERKSAIDKFCAKD